MRIAIIEDEVQIREGLQNAIEKMTKHTIVGTATDGVLGKELILRENPDLIISDVRMPIMDGLTMLKELQEENFDYCAILISGYSEFEYARTAIKLNVHEYLLKPLELSKLIDTLDKMERKILHQKHKEVSIDQLLWSYILSSGQKRDEYKNNLESQLKINSNTRIDMFLLELDSVDIEQEADLLELISKRAKMQIFDNYIVLSLRQEILFLTIDTRDQYHIKRFWEKRILPDIQKNVKCYLSSNSFFGISELPEKLEQLRVLNGYSFEFGNEYIISDEAVRNANFIELTYPRFLENEICSAIKKGDKKEVQRLSKLFIEQVIEKPAQGNEIKKYTAIFFNEIYQAVGYRGEEQENSIQYLIKNTLDCRLKSDLIHLLESVIKIMDDVERFQAETENIIVLEVIKYIRQNYDSDISLTGVAEVVNVSPEYLSRLFSQELGINFVTFLKDFRISIAKRFLTTGKYKIKDVAEKVGYNDTKYFNKIFKSACGMTPSEFQEKHRVNIS